jgi:hypothetical protein
VPFLGSSGTRGWDLVATLPAWRTVATWLGALGVLGAGVWWARSDRRVVAAGVVTVGLVVAGLATGTNIPDSPEQGRLAFYHWAFALSCFEILILVWIGARLAPRLVPGTTHGRRSTAWAISLVVVLGVAITPLVAERQSDRLQQPIATGAIRRLVSEIERADLGSGPVLVLVHGDDRYIQVGDTVGARLVARGTEVVFPPASKGFVHPDRLADVCRVRRALVVSLDLASAGRVPGRAVASVDAAPGLDRAALGRLEAAASGAHVELGPDLQRALDAMPGDQGDLIGATIGFRLGAAPRTILLNRANLELFLDHPPAEPRLSHDDLQRVLDSLPEGATSVVALRLRARLLDRADLRRYRPDLTADC